MKNYILIKFYSSHTKFILSQLKNIILYKIKGHQSLIVTRFPA